MKRRLSGVPARHGPGMHRGTPTIAKTRVRVRLIDGNQPIRPRRQLADSNDPSLTGRQFRHSVRPNDSPSVIDPANAGVESSLTDGSVSRTPKQQRVISMLVGAALAFVIYSSFGLETTVVFAFGYVLALALPR